MPKIEQPPSGPLRGVRIVEFSGIGPGPFAGMLLSDMGADVVRIVRQGTPPATPEDFVNRGRPILSIDIKSSEGREDALKLLGSADALIEGFRPGVMERNGLAPDEVWQRNPRVVYGRMTGWGQDGPLSPRAGHDINYISLTGALAAIGTRAKPVLPLNLAGDYGGGALYLVVGLLAALLEARVSGKGQVVDAAMCDGALSLMTQFYALREQGKWKDERQSNLLDGGAPFYGVYECQDGRCVAVGPIEPQFYAILRERLNLTDPVFDRQLDPDVWTAVRAKLEAKFATRPRDEWCALFDGSDGCVTPVLGLAEAPTNPHFLARQNFVTVEGRSQPAPAPRFSRTQSAIQSNRQATTLAEVVERWALPLA